MGQHTTNYYNTLIVVAEDCREEQGQAPPLKGDTRSVANLQFDMIRNSPYRYTSDDVMFEVYAQRNDLSPSERSNARDEFFSKGQPCFRASPLTKRYGWGVHYDSDGRIAIYGRETEMYQRLQEDKDIKVLKAMRSSK